MPTEAGKFLAGGYVLLALAFSGLGLATGDIQRLVLNEPWSIFWVMVLVGLAVVLGVLSSILGEGWIRQTLQVLGLVLLLVGIGRGVYLGALSVGGEDRALITASLSGEGQMLLDGQVVVERVKKDESVEVRVDARRIDDASFVVLMRASVGPRSNGTVEFPVKVLVDSRVYREALVRVAVGREAEEKEPKRCSLNVLSPADDPEGVGSPARRQGCVVVRVPAS